MEAEWPERRKWVDGEAVFTGTGQALSRARVQERGPVYRDASNS